MKRLRIKISYNSPVILTFSLLAFVVMFIDSYINQNFVRSYFMVYRSSLLDPFFYFRLFSYCLGHSGWSHFMNNFAYILLIGPLVEEKYGSEKLLKILLITVLVGGLVNVIFFPRIALCGASGVVFMLIILSSITSIAKGDIPITFILVCGIYLYREVYNAIFVSDNISQLTHIMGGLCGAFFGLTQGHKRSRR
ncbi:MAG: rhomboid family intramembrane serine protease [Erysipelotrichaceae bacterium]|nr:rhomboid family intramembrane serine protease [Erysipelotrichaceae bacterium]